MVRRTIINLVAASVLCAAANAHSQPAAHPVPTPPQQVEARMIIVFPGGTVADYTAAVRKAFPGANIAVAPGIETVRLAPVDLTNVNFNEAMFAIPTLSESPVSVDWFSTTALVDGAAATKRQGGDQTIRLKVWSMAEILAQTKPEDALSAVQTALDLTGPGSEVKFHADSQLLMVRGTIDQIDAAAQVVDRLATNTIFERGRAEREREPSKALEEAVETISRLQSRIAQLEAELARRK